MLKDGRRLATLTDVREIIFELTERSPADKRLETLALRLGSAKDDPTREAMRSLQQLLWLTLEAKGLI